MNPMDMNDEQFALYNARRIAANGARKDGLVELAASIEGGNDDANWRVRLARFF